MSAWSPCAKVLLAVFGGLFLIALFSVPVTISTTGLRQDPGSPLVFRTTYPRNTTVFLPSYILKKARRGESGKVTLRSAQWLGTVALVTFLGLFDYVVFCHLGKRKRPEPEESPSQIGPSWLTGPGEGTGSAPPKNSGPRGA